MSRWRDDPERAADALGVQALEAIPSTVRLLLVDPGAAVVAQARHDNRPFEIWCRRCGGPVEATADPPCGPFDVALIRLPKTKDEWVMRAHQAASVTELSIVVYGGNDEGIRSAARAVEIRLPANLTIATGGHGRIVRLDGPRATTRGAAVDWRLDLMLPRPNARHRPWVSYPGLFAGGTLDPGTALLLEALARLPAVGRVLDYGCGTGFIAGAILDRHPDTKVDALDNDSVALLATRANAPAAQTLLADRLPSAVRYDRIVSNPAIHVGIAEDHRALDRLIADAPARLTTGGELILVVQSRLVLAERLGRAFATVDILAEDRRFRVWRGQLIR